MLPTANDWLSAGSVDLIEQIVVANNDLLLKSQHDKPKNLNTQQFIEHQWKLAPNLKIIKSKVEYNQGAFKIHLSINQAGQKQQSRRHCPHKQFIGTTIFIEQPTKALSVSPKSRSSPRN